MKILKDKLLKLLKNLKAKKGYDDLFYLAKNILGYKDAVKSVHDKLCKKLQNTAQKRKLILLPRGTFKTSIATVSFPIWALLHNPDLRVAIDSEVFGNSIKYLKEIRLQYETNVEFKLLYGDYTSKRGWLEEQLTISKRKRIFKEPSIDLLSVDTVKVGMHYDIIICDDLVSDQNTTAEGQMQKVIDHYKLLYSLLEPNGILIIIGTRWHWKDLYQHIIDENPKLTIEEERFDIYVEDACPDGIDGGKLFFPQRLTRRFLQGKLELQGSYIFNCTPAETPILMSDWTTKPISQVKPGDEIIGYTFGKQKHNKLVKTKVLETNSRIAPVKNLTMQSGRKVRCTADHKWFTNRFDPTHKPYLPAKIGRPLMYVYLPPKKCSTQELLDYRYLAGLIDGEGACKYGSITIFQSRDKNPEVTEEIKNVLQRLKLPYGEKEINYKTCTAYWLTGGMETKLKIIKNGNPAKKEQILGTIWKHPGNIVKEQDKVMDIKDDGLEPVYALTTGTGNYIAWGYASKNCQYKNSPTNLDDAFFKNINYYNNFDEVPKELYLIGLVDPAISENPKADFFAILMAGIDKFNNYWILDYVHAHLKPYDIIKTLVVFRQKWHPHAFAIESNAFQRILKYEVERIERKAGVLLPIIEAKNNRQSKKLRILSLQPYFEQGKIFIRRSMTELETQILTYPRAKHEDLLDALAMGPEIAHTPFNPNAENPTEEDKKEEFLRTHRWLRRPQKDSSLEYNEFGNDWN